MQVFSTSPPNIIQPIFRSNNWHRRPIVLMDNVSRWRAMAQDLNLSTKAQLRLEWMIFYETAGNKDAYKTAKHFAITPKTFYKWHKRFDHGLIERLEDESRAPINRRRWEVTLEEQARIKKLRQQTNYHYGKRKLKELYENEYGETISTWKIERVIRHFNLYLDQIKQEKNKQKRLAQSRRNRIQKLNIKEEHWFLFHLDTIVVYWGSVKRYLLTAIDHHGKIAYARCYKSKSSRSAKDFLYRLHYLIDTKLTNIQTDNGSEFYGEFEQALQELEILHWFSRPRTPQDNAVCERFNQTLEYEWLYDGNFTSNCDKLNRALTEWLIEYNFRRPHEKLDYKTPFAYFEETLKRNNVLLPMYPARTIGMINVVGKRQDTYKISPLIVAPEYRSGYGVGSSLLAFAENYAQSHGARQMYCTVAESNDSAFSFFVRKGYVVAGRSESHYKEGVVETMMYKLFVDPKTSEQLDASNISVVPLQDYHKPQATELMLSVLPQSFRGVDANWVQALYDGYDRRNSEDINTKFKLIYVAVDRDSNVLGIAGATPKKGQPIKLMPLVATSPQSFVALLRDLPFVLKTHGHKIYIHIVPDVDQTISLQRLGWKLDAAMPAAYHEGKVTQQWSFSTGGNLMRTVRVKDRLLQHIMSGEKTLEVRVAYDNIKTIRPGERVKMASGTSEILVDIVAVRNYTDFEQMLKFEDPGKIVPGKNDPQVLWLLREIYPEDRESLGVVVLELKVT